MPPSLHSIKFIYWLYMLCTNYFLSGTVAYLFSRGKHIIAMCYYLNIFRKDIGQHRPDRWLHIFNKQYTISNKRTNVTFVFPLEILWGFGQVILWSLVLSCNWQKCCGNNCKVDEWIFQHVDHTSILVGKFCSDHVGILQRESLYWR